MAANRARRPTFYLLLGGVGLFILFSGIFWTHLWPNIVTGAALTVWGIYEVGRFPPQE